MIGFKNKKYETNIIIIADRPKYFQLRIYRDGRGEDSRVRKTVEDSRTIKAYIAWLERGGWVRWLIRRNYI